MALQMLKETERTEFLYIVIKDADIKRLLVAWTIYGSCTPKKNDVNPDKTSFDELVKAAWFGAEKIDHGRLAYLSGLSERTSEQKISTLIEYGLIYPDGTANERAMSIVRAEVGNHIRSLAGWPIQKPK